MTCPSCGRVIVPGMPGEMLCNPCRDGRSKVTQLPPGTAHGLERETVGDLIYRQHGGGGPDRKPKGGR